ncbi:waprin-Phi2-like [Rhinatrema bivittatum]|uniref:waprin-Phi2-like n=1 Tax=Rhinatrema bivittatum TaxID=194408 RepID=UPI0011290072|nr:waprin-Phi2-like [Rhinatrema bivittatum]
MKAAVATLLLLACLILCQGLRSESKTIEKRNIDCPNCKAVPTFIACKNSCTSDSDCTPGKMCCYNGCKLACLYFDGSNNPCMGARIP